MSRLPQSSSPLDDRRAAFVSSNEAAAGTRVRRVSAQPPVRLAPEDEARWWRERGQRELGQILYWRWDPIGVQDDLPYSEGEYDSYAPRVLAALQRGASPGEIAALLANVERVEIGMSAGDSRADAARLIVAWYDKSRRYWHEFDRNAEDRSMR